MTGDAAPVLDPEAIATLRALADDGENPAFIATLVTMFTSKAPTRLAEITRAIHDRDAAALVQSAHTLKGNCSMLGAMTMAGHCGTLEDLGERQAFDEAAALLPVAAEEFDRTMSAVAQIDTVITPRRREP
jgi:HPt (histidine-containing phosphotransfer) domain-containing protein